MQNVLADLCIEAEAHTLTALSMAAIFDKAEKSKNEYDQELFRISVSIAKYFITKRQPNFVYECMETFGGNGFVEEQPMAKLFRHSPLNSIWEGSGNIIALDILRGAKSLPLLINELNQSKHLDKSFDKFITKLSLLVEQVMKDPMSSENQRNARAFSDQLALGLEASILLKYGNPIVS